VVSHLTYQQNRPQGFSLVELLLTLAIMGLLMAFTIPALFQMPASKQTAKYTQMARNAAFMILSSYERYKTANSTVLSTVTPSNLTPYMNYVKVDSTSTIDSYNGATTDNCATANFTCLRLHNGGMLAYQNLEAFGGTNTTNAIYFKFDPDGRQTDNTTNGPGKALVVFLQYNGTLHSWGTLPTTVQSSTSSYSATPTNDPVWFTGF
jgi:prepilin-type N-terminal cleavage/methylation domain-containing protein